MRLSEARVPGEDLVDYRVVLHGAAAEGVDETRVYAVVHLAQVDVVAEDLHLADLGQATRGLPGDALRDEPVDVNLVA